LRRKWDAQSQAKPNLSFKEVWEELERNFALEDPHRWRQLWDAVKLKKNLEKIEARDWMAFQSDFEVARDRVPDWTEAEEMDRLLQQLTPAWRTKVLTEEAKNAISCPTVKLSGCPLKPEEVQLLMNKLKVGVKEIKCLKNCANIELQSQADLERLVGSDIAVNGRRLKFMAIRKRWRTQDVFDFVAKELRIEAESSALSRGTKEEATWRAPTWERRGRSEDRWRPQVNATVKEREKSSQRRLSCWTCLEQGKPSNHDFKSCKASQEAWRSKSKDGRGRGKGEATPGEGGKGENASGGMNGKVKER
jgi:hypothetical protein